MSVYLKKGKGWRYDFTLKSERYTQAWYKTKTEAKKAEADKRREVLNPQKGSQTPIDMAFLELVNVRLDYIKERHSKQHYADHKSMAKRWVQHWGRLQGTELTSQMIEAFLVMRKRVSPYTANKDLKSLRSMFNWAKKKKLLDISNPTDDIEFFAEEEKIKYVPSLDDIYKVIAMADFDAQDYLWTIRETIARVSEVNRLVWDDVNFSESYVVLYTRKKKGSKLTPRKVSMTKKLSHILARRYENRDPSKPWVFWHRYWSRKENQFVEGPYDRRKKLMKGLCKKADVQYFNFHALRHAGASLMENNGVPLGAIQRILGHESQRTTEIYLHTLGRAEREAMDVFERVSKTKVSHRLSHSGVTEDTIYSLSPLESTMWVVSSAG